MRLYIIRHADPDYANDTITAKGHNEAEALSKRLLKQGVDRIFCSPAGRAIDTMKYSAQALHLDYKIEEWLREWKGFFTYNSVREYKALFQFPGEAFRSGAVMPTHETWHRAEVFENGIGEIAAGTFDAIKAESDNFIGRLGYEREGGLYRPIKANREQVAIFCHAGLALTWLSHLLEIPLTLMWSGFWIPPGSVTTILFEERSSEWAVPRCLGLGDVSHLYESGLDMSTMGLEANTD